MYSAQHIMSYITMRRKHKAHVHGDDNVPAMDDQNSQTSLKHGIISRTWNNYFSGNYLQSMLPANNQLSITVVNDEVLTSGLLKNSSTKIKDSSYILQEEKFLHDLKQKYSKDYIESKLPVFMSGRASETDFLVQDWHIIDNPNSVKIKNNKNLLMSSGNTYEDNTIESHSMLQVNETEKTMDNNMTDASGPSDVEPQKREIAIHDDTDVESFLVVSHSDVPATPVDFITENPTSHFSNVCQNIWNSLASRLHCKTGSAKKSVKRPYSTKQHHRRKAITIAMGRGRGRAKCQLRRSGVSQTICRKECIRDENYEAWQNNLIGTAPNDCPLDNMGILDSTQFTIDRPSSFTKATPTRRKPKARKKKKTKAKYVTKMRYTTKSSRINDSDSCEGSEMSDVQEDSSRSRTLSESSSDADDWIVFENDDDEKLPETREKRGATKYPTARYVPISSIRKNDSSYKDSSSGTHDIEKVLSQLRSLSESSTDSEDSNHSSTVSNNYKCSMNISEDFNRQTQEDLSRCRLLSDSSDTSDGSSNISDFDSSFSTEENDDVDGYDEVRSLNGDSQDDSIIFADEDSEELTAQIKKERIKKVNFNLTPVVHVMVTWNYAYRAARLGHWEQVARDNKRFRGRINSIAIVLDPILKSTHRSQVWQKRFAFPE